MHTTAKTSYIEIMTAQIEEENPLPFLKDLNDDRVLLTDDTLTDAEKKLLGKETAVKVLPYLIQNRYTRNKTLQKIDTIVLENDKLKAVFLPSFGGRLYSLYNKEIKKELLFKNPVIQTANIAIRDAWIAGGIEWNIGRIGHSVTTSDSIFFAVLKDDHENEFLRMYEFERQNRLYWQVDIHLPVKSEHLSCYTRIINTDNEDKHLYWWTNVALPLTEKTRIFSATDEVFYIKPFNSEKKSQEYGHGKLPSLKAMSDKDVTYPENLNYGTEFFFQNSPNMKTPWEAAVYEDKHMFYECSTQPLRIRKMFTWGKSQGGENWQDFLALKDTGKYVEIQAGLSPSQLHGYIIDKNTEISFTQIFGACTLDDSIDYMGENYMQTSKAIESCIYSQLTEEMVHTGHTIFEKYKDRNPLKIISEGSEFAELEELKSSIAPPLGLVFKTDKKNIWFDLLEQHRFSTYDVSTLPLSYMTDKTWQNLYESLKTQEERNWFYWYHYALFLYENNRVEESLKALTTSLNIEESAWAYYVKGMIFLKLNKNAEYIDSLEKAYSLGINLFAGFAEALISAYVNESLYKKAYELYLIEKDNDLTKMLLFYGAKAGLELGDFSIADELYKTEIPNIREGGTQYSLMWFEYMARKYAKENDINYTPDILKKIRAEMNPPKHIDFRMNDNITE